MAGEAEPEPGAAHAPHGTKHVRVQRARGDQTTDAYDALVLEEPLEIRVGRAEDRGGPPRSLAVTMRTPGQDLELAVGFLFTEGILRSREDVTSVAYARTHLHGPRENVVDVILEPGVAFDPSRFERNFYTTSSCGVCGKASLEAVSRLGLPGIADGRLRVPAELVPHLPSRLRAAQTVFSATGGLHAAGRFDATGTLLAVREDVGRHNAVDKLIGERVLAGHEAWEDEILVVSGRASFEILQKAAVARVPFVVAVGAPSSLAVDLARDQGITLAGFVRDRGFNVYAGAERIVWPASGAGA